MIIISDRCPWCGEKLHGSQPKTERPNSLAIGRGLGWCRSCGNWYTYKPTLAAFVLFTALFIGCAMLKSTPTAGIALILICCFLGSLLVIKLPRQRYITGTQTFRTFCNVKIDWDKKYFMLNLRVWSGYVFPVCFIDESDMPQSLMWCVEFDISKRYGNTADASMCFLKDEAPAELIKTGNRFNIYYNKQKIGQGIITADKIY
ncbi:MAG: hypothetical protein IKS17_04440 [Firmicutes bacterium]|nr:hypothetical protein [Bacillota bacterium]